MDSWLNGVGNIDAHRYERLKRIEPLARYQQIK